MSGVLSRLRPSWTFGDAVGMLGWGFTYGTLLALVFMSTGKIPFSVANLAFGSVLTASLFTLSILVRRQEPDKRVEGGIHDREIL